MSGNSFGQVFKFTTWGESHGPSIGCVVDGVPAQIPLTEEDLQPWLDQRKPGQSKYTTQRRESDSVKIVSGVFEGKTTGTPIGLIIENEDQRSKDYGDIKDKFRPGHADFVYWHKYGIRDYRGGGRSSARETAMRVAAGGIARKVLDHVLGRQVKVRGGLIQMGGRKIQHQNWDWDQVTKNPFFSPDAETAELWGKDLDKIRKSGSSVGAVIQIIAEGLPPGLGCPVYDKLDADIAKAFMSINAVKAVDIGGGFDTASLSGEENADEMRIVDGQAAFFNNNAGGILGGLSTGQPIVASFAVKPTSSILTPRKSINRFGEETDILTKGRHDPCVGIRAVPVGEAMMAIVLADHLLRAKAEGTPFEPRPWDRREN
ncbi:chorismate synthase [Alphaproteobacteria bacterium]|jgi:chorismate synthase|nr:chorismate synthase [Alphaproteobacteria bacterium]